MFLNLWTNSKIRLEFKQKAFDDLQYWIAAQARMVKRIMKLTEDTQRDPFGGLGKPEPLKNRLSVW